MRLTLRPRCCPVCGTATPARLFAEANVNSDVLDRFAFAARKTPEYMHWRLVECQRCDLLYADPAPAAEELSALYGAAAFASAAEARHASRTYGRLLPRIIAHLPDRVGALDVGAGDGAFLHELLAAGFTEVAGIEPSAAPIAAADPAVRPLLRQDVFRAGTFAAEQFRLVTCFQTIEHVPDPAAVCREAWRVLKTGGALFLIGHNRRALSARVLGRKSPIFDVEHLQLFSPRSVRRLLEVAGFTRVEVWPLWNRYPLSYWMRLFPLPARGKARALALLERSRLGQVMIPLPAGNLAAVGYKRSWASSPGGGLGCAKHTTPDARRR